MNNSFDQDYFLEQLFAFIKLSVLQKLSRFAPEFLNERSLNLLWLQ
jgi:hypothetical protein